MTSKKTKEEPTKVAEPQFTPAEYRDQFCMVRPRSPAGSPSVSVAFAVANTLFAWESQAHHFGADSFKLTQKEFEQALLSAMKFPCEKPFPAAVPRVIQDKFKTFKPKKVK